MGNLHVSFPHYQNEEKTNVEFCKAFTMKTFALRGMDHYGDN